MHNPYYKNHEMYELWAGEQVPEGSYIGIRLDGRAFHTALKSARKPFDAAVTSAMRETTEDLLLEAPEAFCAYFQSDEITLIFRQDANWFQRRVEKLATTLAAVASVAFTEHYGGGRYTFDARVLNLPNREAVQHVLAERQLDATKNAISTWVYWHLRQQEGHSKSTAVSLLRRMSKMERVALMGGEEEVKRLIHPDHLYGVLLRWKTYESSGYNPILQRKERCTRRMVVQYEDLPRLHLLDLEQFWYVVYGEPVPVA